MPCDSVITQQLDLNVANPQYLDAAFQQCGYDVVKLGDGSLSIRQSGTEVGRFKNGTVTSRYLGEEEINRVRKQYSNVCIQKAAQRFGGRVRMTGQNTGKIVLGN